MPTGPEQLVLAACDELAGHGHDFVVDSDIARKTRMAVRTIQDCLRGLDRDGYVDLAPLENGSLKAAVAPKGRQELAKFGGVDGSLLPALDIQRQVKAVPKGLRSFDEHDADFFLELLPGPRRFDGLPESIHFWKVRIEETNAEKTFRVGVIFGPSGCGKSSLVKAGLLPRLAKSVIPVYVESSAGETEVRLLRGLRKQLPDLPPGLDLQSSLAAVKQKTGGAMKVLLVIDQFEQWLQANWEEKGTELVTALSECDGERAQAIVTIREDFSTALHRFLQILGVTIDQNRNYAFVDLFDRQHARRVLAAFGRGYGVLPDDPEAMSAGQNVFLDQAIDGLSREGRVISVRLSLFAEMVKGEPWTPETLERIGGVAAVGVTFLEESFSARSAPPPQRVHQRAAQAVLMALLPETGSDIKGHMRSYRELLAASGYGSRPNEFDDLLRILDGGLRLITPTDPEGATGEETSTGRTGERYYQLTHDYLVHALRDWLTRKQRETRRGRAELRLAERSRLWSDKPEDRYLPSLVEWATIWLLTKRERWTDQQRTMMRRAGRVHEIRGVVTVVLLSAVVLGGITYRRKVVKNQRAIRAAGLVQTVLDAATPEVADIVKEMGEYRQEVNAALKSALEKSRDDSSRKLHASLALLDVNASQVDYLFKRLLSARPSEITVLREALKDHRSTLLLGSLNTHRSTLTVALWAELAAAKPGDPSLLPSASALAIYDPDADAWKEVSSKVAQALVSQNAVVLGDWLDALRPVRGKLNAPLAAIFQDRDCPMTEASQAASILASYAVNDPELIADLLMDSDRKAYADFFPIARSHEATAVDSFRREIRKKAKESDPDPVKDRLAERQARAAIALLRMGKADEIMPFFVHSADPRLRSFLINWLAPLGADPQVIGSALERSDGRVIPVPAPGRQRMEAVLFDRETSTRRALILALGTFGKDRLSSSEREPLCRKLLDLYRNDPDSGIHGAAAWTLRKWDQQPQLLAADAELMKLKDLAGRRWFVNSQGQAFAVIEGPVTFRMGSPTSEPDRDDSDQKDHMITIPRRFAIADREVTKEQYQRFIETNPRFMQVPSDLKRYSPEPGGPTVASSWFAAAAYCNWLSKQEGLCEDQWCYVVKSDKANDTVWTIPADVLKRTGYRLPTEAEWEYACRCGSTTSRYYGVSTALLDKYAWYQANSEDKAWAGGRLLPNDLGLFDMLGNELEWVQDRANLAIKSNDDINEPENIDKTVSRIIRGASFDYTPTYLRSAYRGENQPSHRNYADTGLRLARTYP